MSSTQNCRLHELLNRARAGDPAARDELFARCRPYVEVVARANVQSWLQAKVDASDLVQQTLLEAHRGFAEFQGDSEGEWLAWLRRILNHNAADFIRRYGGTAKRQARREIPLQRAATGDSAAIGIDPADGGETPSQIVMRHEVAVQLAEAIGRLPDDYQQVILLRNVERLPFDEVGRRMNRSRPAAQMLWMRALKKLQETMEADR